MLEVNDEVWGIDPLINMVHHCRGIIIDINTAQNGKTVYTVQFDNLGVFLLNEHQLTKNLADLGD